MAARPSPEFDCGHGSVDEPTPPDVDAESRTLVRLAAPIVAGVRRPSTHRESPTLPQNRCTPCKRIKDAVDPDSRTSMSESVANRLAVAAHALRIASGTRTPPEIKDARNASVRACATKKETAWPN